MKAHKLQIMDRAVGNCINCGAPADGSLYWLAMPRLWWRKLRRKLKQDLYFIPGLCKPFCGPHCSLEHREKNRRKT